MDEIYTALSVLNLHKLMVEGGASMISSLLQTPKSIDLIVVTVSPVFVGQGVHYESSAISKPFNKSLVYGKDSVVVMA